MIQGVIERYLMLQLQQGGPTGISLKFRSEHIQRDMHDGFKTEAMDEGNIDRLQTLVSSRVKNQG